MTTPHICFVVPTGYSAISGDESIKRIGGAQVQQAIIARELVARGYRVSMICMDHGQEDGIDLNGVIVYKAHRGDGGIPILRFIWPRLWKIWRSLGRANADVYYYRAAGMLAGVIAAYCKLHGKRSIYAVAGDPDLERNTSRVKYKRDRLLFEYGLRNVDQIVVQNAHQQELCRRNYRREPVLIKNCWPAPPASNRAPGNSILWVSMMRRLKRPHLFVELARALPQYEFKMVGGYKKEEKQLFDEITEEASRVPNLEFLGYVPLARVEELFDSARLFVNTSDSEGFPNTFLQAWARGVPTVSFVDCGARSGHKPVGVIVDTLQSMQAAVETLMTDEREWQIRSEESLRYFTNNHSPATVISDYETVVRDLMVGRHFSSLDLER